MTKTDLFTKVNVLNQQISTSPFFIEKKPTGHFITLVTDSSFKIYDCSKLNVIFNGPILPKIEFLYVNDDFVHTISKPETGGDDHTDIIYKYNVFYRSENIFEYVFINNSKVKQIIGFGCYVLILVEINESSDIYVIEIDKEKNEVVVLKKLNFINKISCIFHPSTYVNKIVIAYCNGKVDIFNILKEKTVYTINYFTGCIRIIQQSPVIDVLAFIVDENSNKTAELKLNSAGDDDKNIHTHTIPINNNQNRENKWKGNKIILYNIKKDKHLFSINEKSQIKSLSFKTDNDPHFVYLTINGNLNFVNIEEQRIVRRHKNTKYINAQFLEGENILCCTTPNSLNLYDIMNLELKLLKFRQYMNQKIKSIKFITQDDLVVIGDTEVHSVNLVREERNNMYSIKDYKNGSDLSVSLLNSKIIVSSPDNVYLLIFTNKNGKKCMESYKKNIICASISKCGNFIVICTKSKMVKIHNVDSGLFYNEYDFKSIKSKFLGAEYDSVDSLIFVIFEDRIVKINHITKEKEEKLFDRKGIKTEMVGSFIAIQNENSVDLYDTSTLKISRKFGIDDKIKCFCISPDFKMMCIASFNNKVFIYDIANTELIEKMDNLDCDGMIFSPNMHFLCCFKERSIVLYFNNTIFNPKLLYEKRLALNKTDKVEERWIDEKLDDNGFKLDEKENINTIIDEIKELKYDKFFTGDMLKNIKEIGNHYFEKMVNEISTEIAIKILYSLTNYLDFRIDECQKVINKILVVHGRKIRYRDIADFYEKYQRIWKEREDELIKIESLIEYEKRIVG